MSDTTDLAGPAQPHPGLRVTRDGAVQTVTLTNAGQRNAQTPSLWAALARAAEETPDDVRVVVLRGEGPSFSAGINLRMLGPDGMPGEPNLLSIASGAGDGLEEAISEFQEGFTRWASLPAVVVAAVQGHAIGAGLQLALAADLRLVASDVQLAMREVSLGLVPDLAGTSSLVRLVGYSRALEICATGRFIGASEAVAIGLASAAVEVAELEATTKDLVDALLATPAQALRELKPLLRSAVTASSTEQGLAERQAQARLLRSIAGGR